MNLKKAKGALIPIERQIITIRGVRVIIDDILAAIYGVPTKRLNEQVKRNRDRFPEDFCFQLTRKEVNSIRSQNATASKRNVRYRPYVFTEHGAIMAANILKSKRAVNMSVFVVRAFIHFRETMITYKDLADKLKELEHKVGQHDEHLQEIIETIRQLMTPPEPPKRKIGFTVEEPKIKYSVRKSKR
jgi:hypothetical protein